MLSEGTTADFRSPYTFGALLAPPPSDTSPSAPPMMPTPPAPQSPVSPSATIASAPPSPASAAFPSSPNTPSGSSTYSGVGSQASGGDPDWAQSSEFNILLRKEKIDQLINLSGLSVPAPFLIESDWKTVTTRRRNQLKQYMATSIYGVISTIGNL